MSPTTVAEQKSIIYNVVGLGTEAPKGSRTINTLAWAGGRSGVSIGVLQIDFGQQPTRLDDLLSARNSWILSNPERASELGLIVFGDQDIQNIDNAIRGKQGTAAQQGLQQLDPFYRTQIQSWTNSPEGMKVVQDDFMVVQIDRILNGETGKTGLTDFLNTTFASSVPDEDTTQVIAIFSKLFNQTSTRSNDLYNLFNGQSVTISGQTFQLNTGMTGDQIYQTILNFVQADGRPVVISGVNAAIGEANVYDMLSGNPAFSEYRQYIQQGGSLTGPGDTSNLQIEASLFQNLFHAKDPGQVLDANGVPLQWIVIKGSSIGENCIFNTQTNDLVC